MTYTHIRPLTLGSRSPGYRLSCRDVVCPTHRQICRRQHDDEGCGVAYGCGAGKVFYCRQGEHGCSRRFKCTDSRE